MGEIIEVNYKEVEPNDNQLNWKLAQSKSEYVKSKLQEKALKDINTKLVEVSDEIKDSNKDIKEKYELLLKQNKELTEGNKELIRMLNDMRSKDKLSNIEFLKSKIEATVMVYNVKPTKKKDVCKLVRDILLASYKELSESPTMDEILKVEELIHAKILELKKNNPKWFREETVESDNEIIKRLSKEIIDIKLKVVKKEDRIKELENSIKVQEKNHLDSIKNYDKEVSNLKEEVYELLIEIMDGK